MRKFRGTLRATRSEHGRAAVLETIIGAIREMTGEALDDGTNPNTFGRQWGMLIAEQAKQGEVNLSCVVLLSSPARYSG